MVTLAPSLKAEGSGRMAPSSCSLASWQWQVETLTPSMASGPSNSAPSSPLTQPLPGSSSLSLHRAPASKHACLFPSPLSSSEFRIGPSLTSVLSLTSPSQGSLPAHSQVCPDLSQPPTLLL